MFSPDKKWFGSIIKVSGCFVHSSVINPAIPVKKIQKAWINSGKALTMAEASTLFTFSI